MQRIDADGRNGVGICLLPRTQAAIRYHDVQGDSPQQTLLGVLTARRYDENNACHLDGEVLKAGSERRMGH